MENPFVDLYRSALENGLRMQQQQLELVRSMMQFWTSALPNMQSFATRSPQDVAAAAAAQVSRAAGASESAEAANQGRREEGRRKSG
jgi:hypothetical protein